VIIAAALRGPWTDRRLHLVLPHHPGTIVSLWNLRSPSVFLISFRSFYALRVWHGEWFIVVRPVPNSQFLFPVSEKKLWVVALIVRCIISDLSDHDFLPLYSSSFPLLNLLGASVSWLDPVHLRACAHPRLKIVNLFSHSSLHLPVSGDT